MKRIGTAAARAVTRHEQQATLDEAFVDADARASQEFSEAMARMRTAVEVAHELAGIASPDGFQKRLAYLLATLYFCGGTKREGSRAYIRTLCERTGNTRRTLDRLLRRARELDLLHSRRGVRMTYNRLHVAWIDELVAQKRSAARESGNATRPLGGALGAASGALPPKAAAKVAHDPPPSDVAHYESVIRHPAKWRTVRDQEVYQGRNIKPAAVAPRVARPAAAGLTWPELVELLDEDEEGLEGVLRTSVSEFLFEHVKRYRRSGERIPNYLLDPLLEVIR